MNAVQRHHLRIAWWMILPCTIGLICFRLFPILASFLISFTDWNIIGVPEFVALNNYIQALTSPLGVKVLLNTFQYALVYVPLATALGFSLALLVDTGIKGVVFFRTLYFLPFITATVAIAISWKWMFATRFGILNAFLSWLHLSDPIAWLSNPNVALISVAVVMVWKDTGFYMVLFLAGLQTIDRTLIEAAKLDGANRFAIVWDIILPQLAPMTFFVLLIAMINSAKTFEATISLTNGGPNNASTTLGYAIYQNAFVHFDMGLASAQSWVLCLIVGGISLLHYRLQQRKT